IGIQQVPDPGKTPLHSARFAPARLPEPATSPRPALCAHSCAKLAAIGPCRQDVVQISLTELPFIAVAYGLSNIGLSIPQAFTPDQIPPLPDKNERRLRLDRDEMYAK